MKNIINPAKLLKIAAIVVASSGIYAFGYYGGSVSKILQSNTLSTAQAKELASNYSESAASINGIVESVYIDKNVLADMNAVMNVKRSANGVRIYFGKEQSGASANLIVAVTDNSDDTSFILKSDGLANPCPNNCDTKSQIRN